MTPMLLAMFGALVVGLFTTRFGRRQITIAALIAVALTLYYYFRPMSMT